MIMILLLLFYSRSPRVLTAVTAMGHLHLHTVDHALVVALLIGSLPGVFFGSMLNEVLPSVRLRQVLLFVLIGTGLLMARG